MSDLIKFAKEQGRIIEREELKNLNGGREALMHECPSSEIHCTCNGAHSCVSSVQECWDAC
ncbi:hypothetical protein [uncultured Aquimarina sp.]|uniref:hypothetical protein n=1 Tax=uncultured Aquimarina sp. TaxID=575652 RepID=UPI00260DD166|nr:hypothetical protein [uncultured Aquimarina sp.]